MAAMGQETTTWVKKEGPDEDPNKSGSMVQFYPCNLNIKEEFEAVNEEVQFYPCNLNIKEEFEAVNEEVLEDPLKTEEPNVCVKRDPEVKHHIDGSEHEVVSSRRYESDRTRLIYGAGESCGTSLEHVNRGGIHNELEVERDESSRSTMFNAHTQRTTSEESSFDSSLKCCLRGQELNKLSCSLCLQSFASKYRLIQHVFSHIDGVQPPMYICKSCGEVLDSNVSLNKHLKGVENDQATKQNECDVCGMSFSWVEGLKRHVLIHTGRRPHKCNICGKSFTRLSDLKTHTLIHTGERQYKCNTCGKSFNYLHCLKRHALIHTGMRPHQCNTCGKSFTDMDTLKRHKLIHTGVRYKCNTCGRSCTTLASLKNHALIHIGIRPHKCTTCGKSFTLLHCLRAHALTHTGIRPYKCNTCGKCFTRLYSLKTHELIHTGIKPHKCHTCGKSFTRLGPLKKHALIHSGMRPH